MQVTVPADIYSDICPRPYGEAKRSTVLPRAMTDRHERLVREPTAVRTPPRFELCRRDASVPPNWV